MAPRNAAGRTWSGPARHTSDPPPPRGEVVVMLTRRFPPPSTYSLTERELAAHVRQLRRAGWLRWELMVRFGRRWAA
jgi:hypothetical protein